MVGISAYVAGIGQDPVQQLHNNVDTRIMHESAPKIAALVTAGLSGNFKAEDILPLDSIDPEQRKNANIALGVLSVLKPDAYQMDKQPGFFNFSLKDLIPGSSSVMLEMQGGLDRRMQMEGENIAQMITGKNQFNNAARDEMTSQLATAIGQDLSARGFTANPAHTNPTVQNILNGTEQQAGQTQGMMR